MDNMVGRCYRSLFPPTQSPLSCLHGLSTVTPFTTNHFSLEGDFLLIATQNVVTENKTFFFALGFFPEGSLTDEIQTKILPKVCSPQ